MNRLLDQFGDSRPVTVVIAVPAHDYCPTNWAYDLASMYGFTAGAMPDNMVLGMKFVTGTYLHSARWELLRTAIDEHNADFVLWLDSDMRFPRDTIVRLMKHRKDAVGINYSTRGLPPRYVAIKGGSNLATTEDSSGLEEVDALGFGCLLMKTSKLRRLGRDGKPWFWFDWLDDKQQMVGEDVYFWKLAREQAGFHLYCDHDLSKECAHIGTFEYRVQHVEAYHEADPLTNGKAADHVKVVP